MYKMYPCNCTDCGGSRQRGPCTTEIVQKKTEIYEPPVAKKCDCTDCGGKRKSGKCLNDIESESMIKVTNF